MRAAAQSQKAVSAHFTSEQIPPFGFAEQTAAHASAPSSIFRVTGREVDPRCLSALMMISDHNGARPDPRARAQSQDCHTSKQGGWFSCRCDLYHPRGRGKGVFSAIKIRHTDFNCRKCPPPSDGRDHSSQHHPLTQWCINQSIYLYLNVNLNIFFV